MKSRTSFKDLGITSTPWKKNSKTVCLHDKYVSEESQGKMPSYFLLRKVNKCKDCEKDIGDLKLLRR